MKRVAASLSRRNILIGAGGAALCAIIAAPLLRPAVGERTRRLLASNPLTRRFLSFAYAEQTEWAAQVGSVFTAPGGYTLRLAGVEPLQSAGERPAGLRRRAFLAVFDVAGGLAMAGDTIYTLTHPQYGATEVFLTLTDVPGRTVAVFN
jgi:hypothetical protein